MGVDSALPRCDLCGKHSCLICGICLNCVLVLRLWYARQVGYTESPLHGELEKAGMLANGPWRPARKRDVIFNEAARTYVIDGETFMFTNAKGLGPSRVVNGIVDEEFGAPVREDMKHWDMEDVVLSYDEGTDNLFYLHLKSKVAHAHSLASAAWSPPITYGSEHLRGVRVIDVLRRDAFRTPDGYSFRLSRVNSAMGIVSACDSSNVQLADSASWSCNNHNPPYMNDASREECEICTRRKPKCPQ